MTIHEYYKKSPRRVIAFFEEDPPKEAIDRLKGYECLRVKESEIVDPVHLAKFAAVIFQQRSHQPRKITHNLIQFAETLLWHDCRVFVEIAHSSGADPNALFLMREYAVEALQEKKLPAVGLMTKEEAGSPLGSTANARILSPAVRIFDQSSGWGVVDEDLYNYPPESPPYLALEVNVDDEGDAQNEMPIEKLLLIQRAFHDCIKVKLFKNSDGRSGVESYHAYATHRDKLVGNAPPYEYFVKVGDRKHVSDEYLAYREIAFEHIPFHLGPRLQLARCNLGTKQGIIVCDYVGGSEKLLDVARNGRAVPVIANLFNTTLRVWQGSPKKVDKMLQDYFRSRMKIQIPPDRRPLIQSYGTLKEPTELSNLIDTMPSKPVFVGKIHGDLHALNVLVRNGDAIVIDFEKFEEDLPLLIDLAYLEAGLFVDGFVDDRRTGVDLFNSIKCLYEVDALIDPHIDLCDPSDSSAWFFDCVKQIRMQARNVELKRGQYALTLAVELAKKGCKKIDSDDATPDAEQKLTREDTRALAYVLAERILVRLQHDYCKK